MFHAVFGTYLYQTVHCASEIQTELGILYLVWKPNWCVTQNWAREQSIHNRWQLDNRMACVARLIIPDSRKDRKRREDMPELSGNLAYRNNLSGKGRFVLLYWVEVTNGILCDGVRWVGQGGVEAQMTAEKWHSAAAALLQQGNSGEPLQSQSKWFLP